jgi:HAD superfamily phosphatase (TIGR01668 family)
MVFCPHRMVDSVTHVSREELAGRGIRGIIIDLDNTLVLWQKEEIEEEVLAWITDLQATGMRFCILSNSILSKRSQRIAERLGCHYVRKARKPNRGGFRRAMALMGTSAAETAMIGDQMFTDIWGGNRVGAYTIMVRQIHPHEFVYTRYVSRPPERVLLRWFRQKGHL